MKALVNLTRSFLAIIVLAPFAPVLAVAFALFIFACMATLAVLFGSIVALWIFPFDVFEFARDYKASQQANDRGR
jgi:hypothetical protein